MKTCYSIENSPLIRMTYTNGYGETSVRRVEPIRVYAGRNGYSYMKAYCHLREENRTFRTDRIQHWTPVTEEYLQEYPDTDFSVSTPIPTPIPTPVPTPVPTVVEHRTAKLQAAPDPPRMYLPATSSAYASSSADGSTTPEETSSTGYRFFESLVAIVIVIVFFGLTDPSFWPGFLRMLFTTDQSSQAESAVPVPIDFSRWSEQTSAKTKQAKTKQTKATAPVSKKTPVIPEAKPQPQSTTRLEPKPLPVPIVTYHSYRGVNIKQEKTGGINTYSSEGFRAAGNLWSLKVQIASKLFRDITGVESSSLEKIYTSADSDKSGILSWPEVSAFQRRLTRKFEYKHNASALRPDEFIEEGGGDCEDWALMTCGLFRYWGYESYVGGLGNSSATGGHAIALVPQQDKPVNMTYYHLEGFRTWSGSLLSTAYYIPIDYDLVGGLSSAVGKGHKLERVYNPERF